MLDENGLITSPATWPTIPTQRLYELFEAMHLYDYVKAIFEAVFQSLPVADLTNCWSKSNVESLVQPGSWASLQSAFHFKRLNTKIEGLGQTRRGSRRRDRIQVVFEFDAWDSTSSSSQWVHLSGYKTALVVFNVRSINKTAAGISLSCSCLAIGSHFSEGREKLGDRPPPSQLVFYSADEEEDS
jgi:hypothetical protein